MRNARICEIFDTKRAAFASGSHLTFESSGDSQAIARMRVQCMRTIGKAF